MKLLNQLDKLFLFNYIRLKSIYIFALYTRETLSRKFDELINQ